MIKPMNAKQISTIQKPDSYLNKKGTPSGDAAEYVLQLPPGQEIAAQSLAQDTKEYLSMPEYLPELKS